MSCRPWGGRFLMQTAHLQLQSSRRRIARLLASIAVERARCINRPHSGATVLQSLHNRVKTTACKPWNQRPCQQRDRTRSCSPPRRSVNSTPRRFERDPRFDGIPPLFLPLSAIDRIVLMNRREESNLGAIFLFSRIPFQYLFSSFFENVEIFVLLRLFG